jgi:hypothetical protein
MLLGIAGAYLLRAITEAGIVPQLTGTLVGLLYAGGWLVASIRTAASQRVFLAIEGLTASAIAAPLLWEATTRFHTISPGGAAAALALFIVLGQVVAWKHDHDAIAAITALAGSVTAVALITATLDPVPFAIALLLAAAVVESGAIADHALMWRWIIALAADFCAFLLVYLITRPQGIPQGYAPVPAAMVAAVQISLLAVYLTSMASRTLVRRLRITWFEIAQVAAVVVFAIVTNLRLTRSVGPAMVAAGAVCYLAAFTAAARRPRRNFHAYATFGILLLGAGSFLLFPPLVVAALWSILALAATWLGHRNNTGTLRMQGALYLLAAALACFELGSSWLSALAAAVAYGVILRTGARGPRAVIERVPSAVVAAILAWSLLSITSETLLAARLDAPLAATIRTILISLIAITLGWFGKRRNLSELIWVLYPWMAFGAAKLLLEDFQQGSPATLFVSLLVYGGTLIALPRLLRASKS